jgi:hypothetical protein
VAMETRKAEMNRTWIHLASGAITAWRMIAMAGQPSRSRGAVGPERSRDLHGQKPGNSDGHDPSLLEREKFPRSRTDPKRLIGGRPEPSSCNAMAVRMQNDWS